MLVFRVVGGEVIVVCAPRIFFFFFVVDPIMMETSRVHTRINPNPYIHYVHDASAAGKTETQLYIHTQICTHTYIYPHIHIYIYYAHDESAAGTMARMSTAFCRSHSSRRNGASFAPRWISRWERSIDPSAKSAGARTAHQSPACDWFGGGFDGVV